MRTGVQMCALMCKRANACGKVSASGVKYLMVFFYLSLLYVLVSML